MTAITAASAVIPAPTIIKAFRRGLRPVRWPTSSCGSAIGAPGPPAAASTTGGSCLTEAPLRAQT